MLERLPRSRSFPPRPSSRLPGRAIVAVVSAVAAAALLFLTGSLADTRDSLIIMGFDADRAHLLTALLAGSIAAATASLVADSRRVAAFSGLAVVLALFAPTFRDETDAALASSGALGRFDAVGWVLTLLTIAVTGLMASWASAVVSGAVRQILREAGGAVMAALGSRSSLGRSAAKPALVLVTAALVAVTIPIFGDMVNYSPDARMRVGAPPAVGLLGAGPDLAQLGIGVAGASGAAGASNGGAGATVGATGAIGSNAAGASAAALPPGLLPPVSSGGATTSSARPWLAWRPSGHGRIVKTALPAPWTGAADTHAALEVYLPPGYDQSTRSYPVVYEVPWSFASWQEAIQISDMLDTLIDGGQIPALIVVFDAHNGAPMPDSECVDSLNGRQQLETYMTQTVVNYVDSTYRTIPTAAARALFGFSEGGYCAPMLLLRHPDVFSEAIAMSGYFQAAIVTRVTINAALPFGGDQRMITDHSPLALLPTLSPDVRSRLFLVVSADSRERLYGPQYLAFAAALAQDGYHYVLMPTRLGHAWNAVRTTLPLSLQVLAGRWVALGVLGA